MNRIHLDLPHLEIATMYSTAHFTNIAEMAIFCAELTKQNIRYDVKAYDDNSYVVTITGF